MRLLRLVFAFSCADRLMIVSMVALAWLASTVLVSPAEAQRIIGLVAETRSLLALSPEPMTFTVNVLPASAQPTMGFHSMAFCANSTNSVLTPAS
jgi:hypothetical protein